MKTVFINFIKFILQVLWLLLLFAGCTGGVGWFAFQNILDTEGGINTVKDHINSTLPPLTNFCEAVNIIAREGSWDVTYIGSIEYYGNFRPGIFTPEEIYRALHNNQQFFRGYYWVDFLSSWIGCNTFSHPTVFFALYMICLGLYSLIELAVFVFFCILILGALGQYTAPEPIKNIIIIIIAPTSLFKK